MQTMQFVNLDQFLMNQQRFTQCLVDTLLASTPQTQIEGASWKIFGSQSSATHWLDHCENSSYVIGNM